MVLILTLKGVRHLISPRSLEENLMFLSLSIHAGIQPSALIRNGVRPTTDWGHPVHRLLTEYFSQTTGHFRTARIWNGYLAGAPSSHLMPFRLVMVCD